jgi:hypothetical protein
MITILEGQMNPSVVSKDDVIEICMKIANELDFPDNYLQIIAGKGNNDSILYFRIKKKSFASINSLVNFTRFCVKSKYAKESEYLCKFPVILKVNDYVFNLGLDHSINDFYNLMRDAMKACIEDSDSDSFGCCSLYNECSIAKYCISPYKELRYSCQYRLNLKKGKIYYGSNPTI